MKKEPKEKSNKVLKEVTIETIKDIEKIFQGIGSIFKNMWNFFTNPSRILGIFNLQNLDSIYDKFLKNEKLMKTLAFIVAILVVISTRYTPNLSPGFTESVSNRPVRIYEDDVNYVIVESTIPDTVTVLLSGDRTQVEVAATRANFEIYVDLRGLSEGPHTVELKYTNISDRVDLSINPSSAVVTLARLVKEERQVQPSFVNDELLEDYYVLGTPNLNVDEVVVSGAESIVNEIAAVRALIDVSDIDVSDVDGLVGYEAPVIAMDREGNRLNVEISPSTVTATIEVMRKSEIVPIQVSITGNPPEGYSISEIIVEPTEIELFGERSVLDLFEYFPIPVDLYQLNEDNEIWVPLELPDDIQHMSEDRIKVSIVYEETETKVLKNVPITLRNLELGYEIDPTSLEDLLVDVTLSGAPSILNQITETHIDVFADLSDLGVGEHNVNIEINTPDFIVGEASRRKVKIIITE